MRPELRAEPASSGRRILLGGTTQGVGLRPLIHRIALEHGVTGRAVNTGQGVTVEAFGTDDALDALTHRLRPAMLERGRVDSIDWEPLAGPPPADFSIAAQRRQGVASIPLSPDLALCADCRAEIADPTSRRHGYAFTSCTACGPRLGVAHELPWERSRTSMAIFPLCDACRREYETPGDRRHHAETNACPQCGPQLVLERHDGRVLAEQAPALGCAAARLAHGGILAVRGLGGYHLACDARDERAVTRLRERKRRPRKPFAVMVRDLEQARSLAWIDADEQALLEGSDAPIVLLRRRDDAGLADAVAPDLPWIGLMLAYTPLHALLLEQTGCPLVMTSGNLSGEPIVHRRDEARCKLAPLVDAVLDHDREITTACDDSVVRVIAGRPCVLRRARGHAPRPISLARVLTPRLAEPVLGCGAQLASSFCLARHDQVWPSHHLGDLDSPEAVDAFANGIDRMETWLGARAGVVAHDLHPGYASTRYALARDADLHVPVQHHHAHVVSAMAEHGLRGPVLGVVFDGTGLGTDGALWGGEVMLADAHGFERLATLRPIALVGGEVAIRETWRLGLAVVDDAFDGAPPLDQLRLFDPVAPDRLAGVRELLERDVRCMPAHGAGRWFDALGALVLERPEAAHQGDVATLWNAVADPRERRAYPFEIQAGAPLQIDLRPMVRAVVRDRIAGRPAAEISGRFHATLASAVAASLARLGAATGERPVVLSGGCFQNKLLAESVSRALAADWRVHRHERIPPGDGGIALGQVVVAGAAALRGGEPACV